MSLAPVLNTLRFIARHPLSSRRPLSAFWRYARWQIESRMRDEVEVRWIAGSKLIARKGMNGATGNIYCGLHEFADMAFALHFLRPDDLFVDVGANVGSYTVLASAVCGARSIAIEPDPGAMQSLRRNVDANKVSDRVTLVEAAMGSASGTVRFTVGKGTTNQITVGTCNATREVRLTTLDAVLGEHNPALIKMDVEGYEDQAVAGAYQALHKSSMQALLIEAVSDEVQSRLEGDGFQRAFYDPFARRLSQTSAPRSGPRMHNELFVRDLPFCQQRLQSAGTRRVLGHVL
jgi:FkbM family methyltransferase